VLTEQGDQEVVVAATQVDVARRAGVSRALVSLVMRGSPKVSEARRQAVLLAAEELGYRPNALAARLASRQSRSIGVVLVQLLNPLFPETLRGVEEEAETVGFGVLLKAGVELDLDAERKAINDHLAHRVDGLVLVSTRLPAAELRELAARVPLVTVFRRVPGVDAVLTDERHGGQLVMEHLLELGHVRIGHIDSGNNPGSRIRRNAYIEGMTAHGLESLIRITNGSYTEPGGRAAAEEQLSARERPTAIFAANDLSAVGAMGAARDRGLSIPTDISVAGFDNIMLGGYGYLSLTSVNQPCGEMGAEAVKLLLGRLGRPSGRARQIELKPELVVRRSTGAPPA
jgi:DNA-binding LacI/PurR family transcriptional regulator